MAGASVPRGLYKGPLVTAAVLLQLAICQGSFAHHLNQPHVHVFDVVLTAGKCSRPKGPFRKLCHLRVCTVAAQSFGELFHMCVCIVAAQISHVTTHLDFIAQRTAAPAKVLSF